VGAVPRRHAVRPGFAVLRLQKHARVAALDARRRARAAQDALRHAHRTAPPRSARRHGGAAQGQPPVDHAGDARRVALPGQPARAAAPMSAPGELPDLSSLWMPFTANRAFKTKPRLLARASGMHYTAVDGTQVLDGTSGLWCVNAGHCRTEI